MILLVEFAKDGFHPASASDGYGGLVHHDGEIAIEIFANTLRRRSEVGEIRATARQGRGTDRNENYICHGDRLGVACAETDVRLGEGEQLLQGGFVNRRM